MMQQGKGFTTTGFVMVSLLHPLSVKTNSFTVLVPAAAYL
jgi:hypothetical protein